MHMMIQAALLAAAMTFAGTSGSAKSSGETPLATTASDPALQWGPCPPIFPEGCEIAVLHGDPALPNADVFLRVPAGYVIPPHRHTSAERMILVTGRLQAQYKGAQATTLAPGSYAYGPAKLPHRASCISDHPCTLFIAFEGAVDAEAVAGTLD